MTNISLQSYQLENVKRATLLIVRNNIEEIEINSPMANQLFDFVGDRSASLQLFPQSGVVMGEIDGDRIVFGMQFIRAQFSSELQDSLNSFLEYFLALCIHKMDEKDFIEWFSILLADHQSHLSLGQARAVIKRLFGFVLEGKERTDLHRLRTKINSYKALIRGVDFVVEYSVKSIRKLKTDLPWLPEYRIYLICNECEKIEEVQDMVINPIHHGKPMQVNWRMAILGPPNYAGVDELTRKIQDSQKGLQHVEIRPQSKQHVPYLVCVSCNFRKEIPPDLMRKIHATDSLVKLPEHHGKEMVIQIMDPDPVE